MKIIYQGACHENDPMLIDRVMRAVEESFPRTRALLIKRGLGREEDLRKGGFFTLTYNDARNHSSYVLLILQIGELPRGGVEEGRLFNAIEKAARLHQTGDPSCFPSRDEDRGMWFGGINGGFFRATFSGLPEYGDEFICADALHAATSEFTRERAIEILQMSANPLWTDFGQRTSTMTV